MSHRQIIYTNDNNYEKANDIVSEILHEIFTACENDSVDKLETILKTITSVKIDRYLNAMMEFDYNGTYLFTPLMIASFHGHDSIVRFLLENYFHYCIVDAQNYSFDHYEKISYKQTALWLAVNNEHLNVVRTLVSVGKANVNHMACAYLDEDTTPLGLACRNGQLDMVKYLIENGADLYKVANDNKTSLMIACQYVKYDIVQYLLSLDNTDSRSLLNAIDENGSTALHAIRSYYIDEEQLNNAADQQIDIVKLLLEQYHAKIVKDNFGYTPLTLAGIQNNEACLKYYTENENRSWITTSQIIDELELIGAVHGRSNHDPNDYSQSYKYFLRAMKLRYKDPNEPIVKINLSSPIEAYDYCSECQTMEELDSIKDNANRIMLEGFMIWERLNPSSHFLNRLNDEGNACKYSNKYQRAIQLYLHAYDLRIKTHMDSDRYILDLKHCTETMVRMFKHNKIEELEFDVFIKVLQTIGNEFLRTRDVQLAKDIEQRIQKPFWSSNENEVMDIYHIDQYLDDILCLIHIGIKISENEQERRRIIHQLIQRFIVSDYRLVCDNKTLLHLSLIRHHKYRDLNETSILTRFPSLSVVKFLLSCQAPINAIDFNYNTPLHDLVASNYKYYSDEEWNEIENIFHLLVNAGAHLDAMAHGQTPRDCAEDKDYNISSNYIQSSCA
ncbi:hypothetical protein I4U23_004514 [Adineta vaga]|nr:hypothetical protein I4U23_004514 [Adineta vaga]